MKALSNLIVLLVLLLCMPVLVYYMYTKMYISKITDTEIAEKASPVDATIQIKNAEIARLKKENAQLKDRDSNSLAQPPKPFGRGYHEPNPNSQSPLAQPPRRVGRFYSYDYSYR